MSAKAPAVAYPIDTTFDAELADRLAYLESFNKHYYRPNTYLHKWWARRCGTSFRLILKHLVTDTESQDYYTPGGLDGRIILDPMIGGGTTLHEALRLGANVIGVDLDPIPVLQARASLGQYPLDRLEEAFDALFVDLNRELAHYYRTTCPHCEAETESWYLLLGARRACQCGTVLLVDSLVLRQESDDSLFRLCPYCRQIIHGDLTCDCGQKGEQVIVERGTKRCPTCAGNFIEEVDRPYYRRFEPLALTGHCPRHNFFIRTPDAWVWKALEEADARRASLALSRAEFKVVAGQKSIQLLRRGIDNYLELFSSRQLLYLQRAIALLRSYEPLERLNLALLLSTSLEFNSLLCGYKGRGKRRSGAIRHTFAHHAYTFPLTAVENNPLYRRLASGTLQKLFDMRIRRARRWAAAPRERDLAAEKATFIPIVGERDGGKEVAKYTDLQTGTQRFLLCQGSATRLDLPDQSVDSIVTDPPYFDSVQYSDLSAFFRVWLRHFLPGEAAWQYDVRQSAVDPHDNGRDTRFVELMTGIFGECARVLRPRHGRLIFTFHHWNPRGWSALTIALKQARFHLLNYAVVHAEHPISVHIANMNALTHDAILVLAPDGHAQRRDWSRPLEVDKSTSAAFCAGCAQLLGWFLAAEKSENQIVDYWQRVLS